MAKVADILYNPGLLHYHQNHIGQAVAAVEEARSIFQQFAVLVPSRYQPKAEQTAQTLTHFKRLLKPNTGQEPQ